MFHGFLPPYVGGHHAREEITFAREEKQNAREEIAFPHEADPIDAVMARRFGAPSRCAKLHSR
ncbi:MAG: hypothetical protein DMG17_29500 [Acidobacteria bacterium]|nr:MAG: hypothetical protein DMG17_29500 [Acidobacteriota bacterium]